MLSLLCRSYKIFPAVINLASHERASCESALRRVGCARRRRFGLCPLAFSFFGVLLRVPLLTFFALLGLPDTSSAQGFAFTETEKSLRLLYDGRPFAETMVEPFSPARSEDTYKVYTHLYDVTGKYLLTKGPGGKFPHHRGLFIGWRETTVGGRTFDTWHMKDCYQEHRSWLIHEASPQRAIQRERIAWCDLQDQCFLEEEREIIFQTEAIGTRVITFHSVLTPTEGTVQFRGDPHHAGMHVRLANEVSEHEDTTEYVWPAGTVVEKDDVVNGTWWVAVKAHIENRDWYFLHITQRTPTGLPPRYSVRKYGRFGAYFEAEADPAHPLHTAFQVVVSEKPLTVEECARRCQAFQSEPSQ